MDKSERFRPRAPGETLAAAAERARIEVDEELAEIRAEEAAAASAARERGPSGAAPAAVPQKPDVRASTGVDSPAIRGTKAQPGTGFKISDRVKMLPGEDITKHQNFRDRVREGYGPQTLLQEFLCADVSYAHRQVTRYQRFREGALLAAIKQRFFCSNFASQSKAHGQRGRQTLAKASTHRGWDENADAVRVFDGRNRSRSLFRRPSGLWNNGRPARAPTFSSQRGVARA